MAANHASKFDNQPRIDRVTASLALRVVPLQRQGLLGPELDGKKIIAEGEVGVGLGVGYI